MRIVPVAYGIEVRAHFKLSGRVKALSKQELLWNNKALCIYCPHCINLSPCMYRSHDIYVSLGLPLPANALFMTQGTLDKSMKMMNGMFTPSGSIIVDYHGALAVAF